MNVTEQRSALESWSYLARATHSPDRIEVYLPMLLSVVGAVGIAPFAVLRFMNGEYLMAMLDLVLVIGLMGLGFMVYRTRRIRIASVAISILCALGVLATVNLIGTRQLFWAYPAVMVAFYLLKPREAVVLVLALIAALTPKLLQESHGMEPLVFAITTLVMGTFAYAFSIVTNRQQNLLVSMATKDPLTGAGNRRALENKLDSLVAAYARHETPTSLIILDLDHFKEVNDAHGHATGDQILCRVTEILNLRIRATDTLYRIGGEEFVVVLEGQSIERATHLAEQLRTLVEANELVPDRAVTISLGVAELQKNETCGDWVARADDALYRAKEAGRNTTRRAA